MKVLPKVPKWRLERDSNQRPFGRKAFNIPMSYTAGYECHSYFAVKFQSTCYPLNVNNADQTYEEEETL